MILNQESHEAAMERRFLQFLLEFREGNSQTYVDQANEMSYNRRSTLYLDFQHLQKSDGYADIIKAMQLEYYRYEPHFKRAIQNFVFRVTSENQENRAYFLSITNMHYCEKIRDLRACKIGTLCVFQGTVTRSSEVRPELIAGSFICLMCNKKIENVEQQFKYTQPKKCTNPKCDNRSKWQLDQQNSIFTDFQKIRVQEDPQEIPAGSMPRSIDVILHNEECDKATPGDQCVFIGTLTVVPDIYSLSKPGERSVLSHANSGDLQRGQTLDGVTGLKQLGVRDLQYKLIFIANNVKSTSDKIDLDYRDEEYQSGQAEDEEIEQQKRIKNNFTDQELQDILRIQKTPDLYKNLASSIAPAIYGHEEVKKGILLMLMSGVNKKTREGVNIRGDINVCIVGDPSTAKSQFLKFVCSFLPRTVYTSGKASSAAGLTASVHKDIETGEFCIEAGALMLADNGICCIDEFDKMESKDQVAIHEAMEQQTISIAKAGIHATLNARASILAAANPIYGRYDRSKTLKFNVNMTQPIMSRFDLFFVITDQSLEFVDQQIATHIVRLHSKMERAINPMFKTEELQKYLRFCRTFKPIFTRDAAEFLKSAYTRLRQNDQTSIKASYRITVRQLESLIRLSEALAKLHCDYEIKIPYVKEAERLLSQSQISVDKPDVEFNSLDEEMAAMTIGGDNIIQEELKQRQAEERRSREKVKISHVEYCQISQGLLLYFKQKEKEREEEISENAGITQSELVEWYLEQRINDYNTEEELRYYEKVLHTIIGNLIRQEKSIIIVKDDPDFTRRQLMLHPNFSD